MRVTRDMIDPELRTAGMLAKALFRPSLRFWKLMHRLGSGTGRDVPGLACSEQRVPSLDKGVDVRVRDVRICVDCALTGRGSDGALFRVSHPKSDTLTAMQPTVMSLECDPDAVEDAGHDAALELGG